MDPRISDEVSITDLFDQFIEASTMRNVLSIHHRILNYAELDPCEFNIFFPKLKRAVMSTKVRKNWKAKALFSKIDKRAAHKCYSNTKAPASALGGNRLICNNQSTNNNSQEYLDDSNASQSIRIDYNNNNALQNYNCLIIGSGPAGLRTAIELQLLGASRVVVVEKRSRFSRNNVLHLWPFVIEDLKSLGAKKFYGKFCAGSIDHISIRQLQLMLLKICLMIGCDFRDSCSYLHLCPSSIKQTKQVKNGNDSDSIVKAKNGNMCDSIESIDMKCDLEVTQENNDSENFTRVNCESSTSITSEQDEMMIEEGGGNNSFITSDSMKAHEGSLNVGPEQVNNEKDHHFKTDLNITEVDNFKENNGDTNVCKTEDDTTNHRQSNTPMNDDSSKPSLTSQIKTASLERTGGTLRGSRAHFQSDYKMQEKELHSLDWDIIIGADGRRNTLSKFFPRKEFRGRLAIAITANFINRQTPAEAAVSEISGLSFIYNQDMFNALSYDTNIQLENICYYKDDTHYFVMTAKKKSLLERGVLIKDYAATQDLLADSNVDRQALLKYAKDAAYWTTGLEPLDFALNHYGQEDCAMFDFTSMYAASNACKALRTKNGGLTLVSLVGDSLLEPFWPTGSGCARGFLSSFDAAWMCRQWAVNKCALIDYHNTNHSSKTSRQRSLSNKPSEPTTYNRMALSVMAERESIYRILAQTTSENLHQNYSHWTLNPHTRYPNLNRHLVIPSQVEHLITDNEMKINSSIKDKNKQLGVSSSTSDRSRRIKSPNSIARRSPKKLKSANASPLMQQKNIKARGRTTLSKHSNKVKSKQDVAFDTTCLEFEESYNNLADDNRTTSGRHLNYRRPNCDIYDDYFIPSISGTLPSSNNLLSLEARRARDIDECLHQRRQRSQLSAVRDQLIDQFKRNGFDRGGSSETPTAVPCGAALFNELRKLKEQQAKGKENKHKDLNGSLTLLNSMRRCASFAERVKCFENKLGSSSGQDSSTNPSTPIIPTDNVKNLPEFATLQGLFDNNSSTSTHQNDSIKKVKMPIMKLSKDDWNVKCWEKRLAQYKQKNSIKTMSGSTKSLNKVLSVDSYHAPKPEKQVEVFKDRIKEMADKLKLARDTNEKLYNETSGGVSELRRHVESIDGKFSNKSGSKHGGGGWVSHLRKELIRGVEAKRPQQMASKHPSNPVVPSKPIKKLFQDDDDEEGDDKHYDHLCVNRPTNKYLPKNGYTSHLTRTKYNSTTSKVINRVPTKENKQAYMNALTSRGSSTSSTLSDYSTATCGSSSGGGSGGNNSRTKQPVIKCFRCNDLVSLGDKITIGDVCLHRCCLTCAGCGITLRTNEIQHYLNRFKNDEKIDTNSFVCVICKPNIRSDLNKEAADRVAKVESKWDNIGRSHEHNAERHVSSRENFLHEKINYNELYKNILNDNKASRQVAASRIDDLVTGGQQNSNLDKIEQALDKERKESKLEVQNQIKETTKNVSPSPVNFTLPMNLVVGQEETATREDDVDDEEERYRIARSESIDGSEQVTLVLPPELEANNNKELDQSKASPKVMIDEEEFHRILHLDGQSTSSKIGGVGTVKTNQDQESNKADSSDDTSDENDDDDDDDANQPKADYELSESSSLDTTQNSDSTYEDFLTSEEFGAASEDEDNNNQDCDGGEILEVANQHEDVNNHHQEQDEKVRVPAVSVSVD